MKAWTLRNLPDELVRFFRHEARERHESVNKTIVSLMIERFGLEKPKKTKEKTFRSQSIFSSLSSILLRFFSAFSLSSVCEQDQTSRRLIKSSNETERSKKKRRNRERER